MYIIALLPMFWALNEQVSSMFPLQATRLNGDLGFYTIKPDQLQLVYQLLVISILSSCNIVLYPLLHKVGIRTFFQKIIFGGFLSISAYTLAGLLELQMATISAPLHMAWMIPQYVMLAMVESIVGVLSMVYANSKAPASLRTVVQALFLSTHGVGSFYDVVVFSISSFSNQVNVVFCILVTTSLSLCFRHIFSFYSLD